MILGGPLDMGRLEALLRLYDKDHTVYLQGVPVGIDASIGIHDGEHYDGHIEIPLREEPA